MVKLKFTIKDPTKKAIRIMYWKKGGSLIVKLKFTIKDPPKEQYVSGIEKKGGL